VMPLAEADPTVADMATCVVIGSALTRIIARPGRPDLVYTPRFIAGESQ
jgi:precorrin-3B C17-methyltransferase